ncbi:MAG: protein translocase subunit SecD [Hyphomicrobiales bacterium]|nr:protein translocase subunit SecD [Hyphomicrobiales bacterium]
MLHFSRLKISLILAVCLLAVVMSLPNFIRDENGKPASWLPTNRTLNLGLDLQGGSYLLLEVDFDTYLRQQVEQLVDDIRAKLRENKIGYVNLGADEKFARFDLRDPPQADTAEEAIRDISRDFMISREGDSLRVSYRDDVLDTMRRNVLEQSIEIVRRRVDETGTREPIIQRQGDNRILLQVPGLQDPERLKQLLGRTAKMTFHLMDDTNPYPGTAVRPGPGLELLTGQDEGKLRYYLIKKRVMLSGELLVNSQSTFERGQPVVSFRFNNQGARKFGDITKHNVGKPFAIVLDGKVISAPRINEPILGGSGIISGGFSVQEAQDLALLLRAGALPAPLEIVEERTVGPSLGQDSIDAGIAASIIGMVLVAVFMLLFYGLFGVFSTISLAVNLVLIMAALSLFGATLTLPGIAGIVLTIGMAVDANVLIFERIREEVNNGRTPLSATESGFKQAFTTILDANVTTLIATLLLFAFGSGPVKGFAVTLSIGIIASMFTAILLTRLMIATWLRRKRPKKLPI